MMDRGMVKWQPFNAVASGSSMINDVLKKKNKVKMPTLSEDQQNELQNKVFDSYETKEEIRIKYFKDGKIYIAEGKIEQINQNSHYIIVNSGLKVFFAQIIEIY